jgi:hypothetical protein
MAIHDGYCSILNRLPLLYAGSDFYNIDDSTGTLYFQTTIHVAQLGSLGQFTGLLRPSPFERRCHHPGRRHVSQCFAQRSRQCRIQVLDADGLLRYHDYTNGNGVNQRYETEPHPAHTNVL